MLVNTVRQFKASIFQALANSTRLQILETLRTGELPVAAILAKVERDPANISQHLTSLRLRGLVVNRKVGNQVFYSVRDPLLFDVLDLMRRYAIVSEADLSEGVAKLATLAARRGSQLASRRSTERAQFPAGGHGAVHLPDA